MALNNPRVGTSVNLPNGAKYDILLIQTPQGYPVSQLSFDFGLTPRKIAGIEKVAQTFAKILFTTYGSDVIRKDLGTEFPNLVIGANTIGDVGELRMSVTQAVNDAESQTRQCLNGYSLDPSSQLRSATITTLDVGIDSITLYIRIITNSGTSAAIAIPFPQLNL